jgi:hypothetical protein
MFTQCLDIMQLIKEDEGVGKLCYIISYNYIIDTKMNSIHMQQVHIICHIILHTIKKLIYLTHMISILNFVFTVVIYVTR